MIHMSATDDGIASGLFKSRPGLLLASLVVLMLLHPLLGLRPWMGAVLQVGFTLVILSSAMALYDQRRFFWLLVTLAAPTMTLGWLHRLSVIGPRLGQLGDGCFAALLLVVVAAMMRKLFTARRVTLNTLLRAMSVYLLLAIAFAAIYGIIAREHPGAFRAAEGVLTGTTAGTMSWNDVLYFSFATLTTLGYGDITPAAPVTRMVVSFEAVIGPLYLAIVVARLVALFTMERRDAADTDAS